MTRAACVARGTTRWSFSWPWGKMWRGTAPPPLLVWPASALVPWASEGGYQPTRSRYKSGWLRPSQPEWQPCKQACKKPWRPSRDFVADWGRTYVALQNSAQLPIAKCSGIRMNSESTQFIATRSTPGTKWLRAWPVSSSALWRLDRRRDKNLSEKI